MHVANAEAEDKASQEGTVVPLSLPIAVETNNHSAAAKMEAMHVAEAQAKDKASQEGAVFLDRNIAVKKLTTISAAAQMEAMHVAEAQAKDKASQEGTRSSSFIEIKTDVYPSGSSDGSTASSGSEG